MVSVLIDCKVEKYAREIKYAFDYVFKTLGYSHQFITNASLLKPYDIFLIYGLIEPTLSELQKLAKHYITIFIQADARLFDPSGYAPEQVRRLLRDIKLLSQTPIIAEKKFVHPAENYTEQDISACKVNFDLIGNVFYHLAHYEEQLYKTADPNLPESDSNSPFRQWKDIPYMDTLLWLLDNLIQEQVKAKARYVVKKQYWPQGQDMAIALTHTVDNLQKWYWNSIFFSIADDLITLVTFRWKQLLRNVWSKLKYIFTNMEMYWNFQEIQALEREHQFHSTWFIAAKRTAGIDYSLDEPDLQDELRMLLRNGNEVALLATDDKSNREDWVTRKQILLRQIQKEQVGIRQADYKLNDKLRDLHQKLLPRYDASSSFQDNTGFKHGMAFPYIPWTNSLEANHLELPVSFRDNALKLNRFNIVELEAAKQVLKKVFQAVRRCRGLFCLDFTVANFYDIPFCQKLYEYLFAMIAAEQAWVATCTEIADWWEKRFRVIIEDLEYEICLSFPEALDSFIIQLVGTAPVDSINFHDAKLDGNRISFFHIQPNDKAFVYLKPRKQVAATAPEAKHASS